MSSVLRQLDLGALTLDPEMQHRKLDRSTVERYCEIMQEGVDFPPVEAVADAGKFYLWDGFHRFECHKRLKRQTIKTNVEGGTRDYALWLSFSANARHGVPRPYGAVTEILAKLWAHPEWRKKGVAEIARHVCCSRQFVYDFSHKQEPLPVPEPPPAEQREPLPPTYEPPPPLLDNEGHEIPANRTDQWLGKAVVLARINELEAVLATVLNNRHEPAYRMLKLRLFKESLVRAKDYLVRALPWAVCPECKGAGCAKCLNSGFIPHRKVEAEIME